MFCQAGQTTLSHNGKRKQDSFIHNAKSSPKENGRDDYGGYNEKDVQVLIACGVWLTASGLRLAACGLRHALRPTFAKASVGIRCLLLSLKPDAP